MAAKSRTGCSLLIRNRSTRQLIRRYLLEFVAYQSSRGKATRRIQPSQPFTASHPPAIHAHTGAQAQQNRAHSDLASGQRATRAHRGPAVRRHDAPRHGQSQTHPSPDPIRRGLWLDWTETAVAAHAINPPAYFIRALR